jgi:serine/threonine protein kinase/ABC-type phosphate/phosphonate transport system substrate-binding protein
MKPIQAGRECKGCGAEIKGDEPFGHCPRCLVELGFGSMPDLEAAAAPRPAFKARAFGDYELLEQIGRGGMGVVYKARQISLNRLVALKMVLDSQLGSPLVVRRFQIEAEAAARLNHPNIVPIYEIGEEEHQHFFSMKLIEGESLSHRLARGEFRAARGDQSRSTARELQVRVAQLMAAVARAVHYAHQHGVLHRDIKPSNILVDAAGQPHLTDFGLAKLTDATFSLSKSGGLMGTPSYMAPEQAVGGTGTIATDIFSLGTILYELLTGRLPFTAPTALETLRLIAEQEPAPPTTTTNGLVDSDLSTICLKCLEKNPDARFNSAQALAEDLERWLRHEPIKARRAGPVLRIKRWTRRNPVGATLILSLFLGLAASLSLLRMFVLQKRSAEQAHEATERARKTLFELIGVSGFWKRQTPSLAIPAKVMALAMGTDTRPVLDPRPVQSYALGLLVEDDPAGTVIGYAALMARLETEINRGRTNQIRFEITLFKRNSVLVQTLVNRRVDFVKLGGNSYVKAKRMDPGIRLIVSQGPPKEGIIFTRDDSDITQLSDLRGRSVIFGDTHSTISTWAYYFMVQAGVSDTNLSAMLIVDPVSIFEANTEIIAETGAFSSHLMSMEAVLTNGFDAGVASSGTFMKDKALKQGFRALKVFRSDPVYFMARSGFPPEVADALTRAMVNVRDPKLFAGISRRIKHYLPAQDSELDRLREAMAVGAKYFGGTDEITE